MAHFVSLIRAIPDPDLDSLEILYLSPSGAGRVGLWGFIDTACNVRVSDGSGSVRPAEKKGTEYLVFDLTGVNDGTTIQAFAGSKPFTEQLPVARRSFGALGAENNRLLLGGDPRDVCHISGHAVRVIPLAKGFGNYQHFPQMSEIHGLGVHITTGGNESLEGLKTGFEAGKSTHFAIDRAGGIAQYIAASFQSQGRRWQPELARRRNCRKGVGNESTGDDRTTTDDTTGPLEMGVLDISGPDVELSSTLHGDKTGRHGPRETLPEHGKGIRGSRLL